MNLTERDDELIAEAKALGLEDRVHQPDMYQRIMAYADVLGYDPSEATAPELPLRRVRPAEK